MTQEEKAKAYDEALERFKSFKEKYYTRDTNLGDVIFDKTGEMQKDFEEIFPELRESEDERIRKKLYHTVLGTPNDSTWFDGTSKEAMLAWLEKQKEQPTDAKSERVIKAARSVLNNWLDGTDCPDVSGDFAELDYAIREYDGEEKQKEQDLDIVPELRPTAWGEGYQHGCKDTEEKYKGMMICSPEEWNEAIADAFKHGMDEGEKQKEQKPAEWSVEDEDMVLNILSSLRGYACELEDRGVKSHTEHIQKEIDWINKRLKSIRPSQKQEWSDEDETAFGDLMWCIEQARKSAKDENDMGNIWFAENWVKNKLKSLRPSWKPSEEQMKALDKAIPVCMGIVGKDKAYPLVSLYEQLKKL